MDELKENTFIVSGSHGHLVADKTTGDVLEHHLTSEEKYYSDIVKFDVDGYKAKHGESALEPFEKIKDGSRWSIDILYISCWTADGAFHATHH